MRHVRETVRFADGIEAMRAAGVDTFVEAGPDSVLASLIDADVVVPTLRRDRDEQTAAAIAIGRLWTAGVPVDLSPWFAGGHRVTLPTYAFQHEHYWPAPAGAADVASAGLTAARHPLLSAAVALAEHRRDGLHRPRTRPARHRLAGARLPGRRRGRHAARARPRDHRRAGRA
nr:hypothetical protein GCM10020092_031900 [Actinoplanes digitatis]